MILNSDFFVLGGILLDSATAMQLWLSLNHLQNTSVFGRLILIINDTYLISSMIVIASRISWINAVYSASIVLKSISVCNLLHHNIGHIAYVITYPVRNITFYALSASA